MSQIQVVYHVKSTVREIESRADSLLLEQAVELPREALHDPWVKENIVGHVHSTRHLKENLFEVIIHHPARTTADDPAQFLNVLFGNSSLQPDVVLYDVDLPTRNWEVLPYPKHGIQGIRKLAGQAGGALTCTALKPMGLKSDALAGLCRNFVEAGIHLIKDDHGLADHRFCPFEERVRACSEAVKRSNQEFGRQTVYAPNLIGSPSIVRHQIQVAKDHGLQLVMLSPMLIGLPFTAELVRNFPDVMFMFHPSFGGALRMEPTFMLGKLFRWFGADIVIYPNHGGRFAYTPEQCLNIARYLTNPEDKHPPSFPCPAGGMSVERVPEILEFYGNDTILLIGGSILQFQDDIVSRSKAFVDAVKKT